MTRQEVVIKISRVSRIIGELKSQIDLSDKIEITAFDPALLHIAEWIEEIYQYIEQEPSPVLHGLISNIGFTDIVEEYVQNHIKEITPSYANALKNYVRNIKALLCLCDKQSNEKKGQYTDLIASLANEHVATLLNRAVDAGLLDKHYQPTSLAKALDLKVIAFAVSTICKLPNTYVFFEKQWHREGNKRFSTSSIPKRNTDYYERTKALYPEIDFSGFEQTHEIETFYTPQSKPCIRTLYMELIKYGYIAPDTTIEAFYGIFDKTKFIKPIDWIKNQRQLSYFVYIAFGRYNKRHLWIKGECCFRINGTIPHRACFVSGCSKIKQDGWVNKYDLRLKQICDKFNQIDSKDDSDYSSASERPIQTSRFVFYSTAGNQAKKALYLALIQGHYIDSATTFANFRGIFDETEFSTPIVWTKNQTQLMYLAYLIFKKDNPFDLWVKCAYCFQLENGKKLHRNNMTSQFRNIIKKGLLDIYDAELKKIADRYTCNSQRKTKTSSMIDGDNNNLTQCL